jgi:hypothetical protein
VIAPRFVAGDFLWCAFPKTERPATPSRIEHIGYTLLVVAGGPDSKRASGHEHDALIAYTTSQPWPHAAGRPGVISFSRAHAALVGQRRAFVLHLWRVARLPVTLVWCPRLAATDAGVVGRASHALRLRLQDEAASVFRRHSDTVERLGPGTPGR